MKPRVKSDKIQRIPIDSFFMNLPSLSDVVKTYNLLTNKKHSKSLGQNFLLDMTITRRIASIFNLEHVVEIGPGPGGLTRALLEKSSHVTAIEKDPLCIEALSSLKDYYKDKLNLMCGDATKTDVFALYETPFRIMANLPYNVGTLLLIQWIQGLKAHSHLLSMTLMLQKEVVDRIVAKVNTKDYGRLSILSQYACSVKREFHVSAQCFTPPPKVTSSVVTLIPKPSSELQDIDIIENITRIAFGQRRKMLRNTLGRSYPMIEEFQKEARPESLPLENWIQMAQLIKKQNENFLSEDYNLLK